MTEATFPMEAVLYCDGGCRAAQPHQAASRGHGGWGVHGYFYTRETPKVGAGAKKGIPSPKGYDLKASGKGEVTVTHYVDAFGSIPGEATNNLAEVEAATRALQIAQAHGVQVILILTDSKYVVNGITQWMAGWARNGWKKPTGEPIPNMRQWQILFDLVNAIRAEGGTIHADWVKGHSGEPGNEMVDRYANRGVLASSLQRTLDVAQVAEAKGYWRRNHEYPRMLNLANWYFTTSPMMESKTADGKTIYYLGDIRDREEFYGKPIANATFAIVYLNEPCALLEKLREDFMRLAKDSLKGLVVASLKAIFSANMMDNLMQFGDQLMILHHHRQAIEHMDRAKDGDVEGIELGHEIRPTRLAFQAVGRLQSLEVILNEVLHPRENTNIVLTDLTSLLYESQVDGKKAVTKLLPAITAATASVNVPLTFRQGKELGTKPVCLTLGQDLPDRNTLAALASPSTKVTGVTWQISPEAFRFATVIECDEGAGLWAGPYANLQLIPTV